MIKENYPLPIKEAVAGPAATLPQPTPNPSDSKKYRIVAGAFRTVLKRLRFIAILAGVGLFIGYWDTVKNYWDKWTQPRSGGRAGACPGAGVLLPDGPAGRPFDLRAQRRRAELPDLRHAAVARAKGEKAKLPAGVTGRVQLSPERIQLAGIKTATVGYRPHGRTQTKTVGYVAYDESRLSRIVSRVDGYVEKLYVDKTFTMVHKGDPLAEIYSPELYSTAQELILATQGAGDRRTWPPARARSCCCWASAGRRSTRIVASGKPSPRLVIRSPQSRLRGRQEDRRRRQRGSEDDALRGGRPLDGLGRGRRLREGHPVSPSRPEGRSHGRGLSQSHVHREARA